MLDRFPSSITGYFMNIFVTFIGISNRITIYSLKNWKPHKNTSKIGSGVDQSFYFCWTLTLTSCYGAFEMSLSSVYKLKLRWNTINGLLKCFMRWYEKCLFHLASMEISASGTPNERCSDINRVGDGHVWLAPPERADFPQDPPGEELGVGGRKAWVTEHVNLVKAWPSKALPDNAQFREAAPHHKTVSFNKTKTF